MSIWGDLVFENNELKEKNHMLKNDLKDLDRYEPEKYKKVDKYSISISYKKKYCKTIYLG